MVLPKNIGNNFVISESFKDKFTEEYIRSLSNIEGEVIYWNLEYLDYYDDSDEDDKDDWEDGDLDGNVW